MNDTRFEWDLGTPLSGDRAISPTSRALDQRTIALLVCGGIAAYKTPNLVRELRRAGARVLVYATPAAMAFTTRHSLEWTSTHELIERLDGRAQHVEDAREVDAWLLAPATYSTINKAAAGIADNAVTTTLATALGRVASGRGQLLVAPTMHGDMLNPICLASLRRLADLGAVVIPPRGEAGKANLPREPILVAWVARALSPQPLTGRRFLLTLGPLPATAEASEGPLRVASPLPLSGGCALADLLWRYGAEVTLAHGPWTTLPAPHPHRVARLTDCAALSQLLESQPAAVQVIRGDGWSQTSAWPSAEELLA